MSDHLPHRCVLKSYRPDERPRTILLPVLIVTVLTAMLTFYWHSKPMPITGGLSDQGSAVKTDAPPANVPALSAAAEPAAALSEASSQNPPAPVSKKAPESAFTPWMSPLALDTYLRQKNRSRSGNYWSQGHWIRAIEGRWRDGDREIRVALASMSRPGEIEWVYRFDLKEGDFAAEWARLQQRGFHLTQCQTFLHPDGTKRYQGVWQHQAGSIRDPVRPSQEG